MSRLAMSRPNERVSYWLRPAAPERAQLSEMIRQLAHQFDAPVFEPHVTLYSGPVESLERIDRVLRAAAGLGSEITLRSTDLAHSDQFTRTLFMEFAPEAGLISLAAELNRLSRPAGDYELKPHLSLVYAELAAERREELARSLVVPATIRFASLQAVGTGGSTLSRADVETWQVWGEQSLG